MRIISWPLCMALVCAAPSGCSHKSAPESRPRVTPKPAPSGARCNIDSKTLARMERFERASDLLPEDRFIYHGLLLERCTGWPPLIRKMFEHSRRPVEWVNDAPTRGAPPPVTDADRGDVDARLEALCPGYRKVAGPRGSAGSESVARFREIWKHCRFARLQVVSEWEFIAHRPLPLLVLVIYDSLARGGMSRRAAALLASLWIPPPVTSAVRSHKIELPTSRSDTHQMEATEIIVSLEKLAVYDQTVAKLRQGRVDESAKRDGPDGFFIDPLFKALKMACKRLQAVEKQGGEPFRGDVMLIADRRIAFRPLAEVLYTAGQALFEQVQILVAHPDEKGRVMVVQTRLGKGQTPPALTVEVSPTALTWQHGTAPRQHIPVGPGGLAAAVPRLSHAVWAVRAKAKTTDPAHAWGTVQVNPAPTVPLDDVLRVLDGLREMPRDATPPPAAKALSSQGCGLVRDRKGGRWGLPAGAAGRCMYPFVILGLGSS